MPYITFSDTVSLLSLVLSVAKLLLGYCNRRKGGKNFMLFTVHWIALCLWGGMICFFVSHGWLAGCTSKYNCGPFYLRSL